jgi:hypothetical protein
MIEKLYECKCIRYQVFRYLLTCWPQLYLVIRKLDCYCYNSSIDLHYHMYVRRKGKKGLSKANCFNALFVKSYIFLWYRIKHVCKKFTLQNLHEMVTVIILNFNNDLRFYVLVLSNNHKYLLWIVCNCFTLINLKA